VDAIGCNTTVIDAIQSGHGNYVIPVKENQKNLLKTILKETEELEKSGRFKKLDRTETLNKKHGRLEKVTMTMIDDTSFIYEKLGADSFYGSIARIGIMDKKITAMKGGEETVSRSRSILITDVEEMSVENFLKIKAAHWNIEMQHWLLDIQLREDDKTSRKGAAITNGGNSAQVLHDGEKTR
jgi:hypothetical protein